MKPKYIVTAAIALVVIFGGYFAVKALFQADEVEAPTYTTSPVEKGDITVGVNVVGSLNPSWGGSLSVPGGWNSSSTITSYVISEVYAEVGDIVTAGQPIVLLAAPSITTQVSDLRKQLEVDMKSLASMLDVDVSQVENTDPNRGISIIAPIAGRLTDLSVRAGQKLNQGDIIARVVNDNRFLLTAKLTSVEINRLKDNWKAIIRFDDNFTYGAGISGDIIDINRNSIPEKSKDLLSTQNIGDVGEGYEFVHWVSVEADNPGLIQPGMIASIGFYDPAECPTLQDAMDNPGKVMWIRYLAPVDGYKDQEEILSRVEGVITKVNAKNMSDVKAGDIILSMAGQDVKEAIVEKLNEIREKRARLSEMEMQESSLLLVAPSNGVLSEFNKTPGTTVNAGEWLGSIFSSDDMRMYCSVDDTDIILVTVGAPCVVTVDAMPDEIFTGEVEYVAASGKNEQGVTTFEVSIKVSGNASIRSGMQAKALIGAASAENVLLIPLEAIFREEGINKVEVLDPDGSVRLVTIDVGLMSNRYAEILSGLEEGEQVITGSSKDLLPSNKNSDKNGGIFGGN